MALIWPEISPEIRFRQVLELTSRNALDTAANRATITYAGSRAVGLLYVRIQRMNRKEVAKFEIVW
jgi:hypothetical protein